MSDQKISHDSEGEEKPNGLGEDGTIPNSDDGVAVGYDPDASTFEPEERWNVARDASASRATAVDS